MVLVMVPGLGFLYSGLARRKSALSMIWACMMSMSVINFQWYDLLGRPWLSTFVLTLWYLGTSGVTR